MADEQAPGSADGTGPQRTVGERRRRRTAERSGQVDLDATMSHWPVTEPPTTPRPVVRPARPTVEGVATGPVLPTPGAMVVGPLLEARSAAAPRARTTGSRRSRRGDDQGVGAPGTSHQAGGTGAAAGGAPASAAHPGAEAAARPGGAGGPAGSSAAAPAAPTTPAATPSRAPRALLAEAQGRGVGGLLGRLAARSALLLLATVLLVALLVAALLTALRPGEEQAPVAAPVPEVPAQQTLALALGEADGAGLVGAALLGVDRAGVSALLVPDNLLLTVADAGELSLGEAAVLGTEPLRRGLEDTLLLRVDGAVLVEPSQLATLVDAVGGVVLDVGEQVTAGSVLVPAGQDQRLAGDQAAAYAGLDVDGEPGEARLARFGAVLRALLAAMPADPGQVALLLEEAGLGAPGGPGTLADVVAEAAARAAAGDVEQVVLPTRELAAGGASLRGLDDDAARAELDGRFTGASLPVAEVGEVRVLVRNGVGRAGLGALARDRLVADGLRYVGGGNVAEFGQQPRTAVLVASDEPEDRARGEAVVAALGLGDDALQVNQETLVDTDVVVVLGDDFATAATAATGVADESSTSTPTGTTPSGEAP